VKFKKFQPFKSFQTFKVAMPFERFKSFQLFKNLAPGLTITQRLKTLRHPSRLRRTDQGDGFPFVPPVDAEIFEIDCDDAVAGIKLAHADEAKIG